jgi:uracil phosphoribosyltransferase
MPVIDVKHPLVKHKIGLLRDHEISTKKFRELTNELARLLAYEATADFPLEKTTVQSWSGPAETEQISGKKVTIVPILRAGLGMLDGMTRVLPTAEVGFLGMQRDEETLEAITYANRLPDDLSGRQCFLLDPMLATGGTLVAAIDFLLARGARDVTAVCLLAAPEGLAVVEQAVGDRADVSIVVAAVDERLNDKAYIVPGLGDAGDRLYGVV